VELLQLKYFQAVARLEHMTRAAEELGIAQYFEHLATV
jgi:DNA-binding transcriptional LysR family regulator